MAKLQQFHDSVNKALADKYQTTPRLIGALRGFVIQEEIDFISYLDFIESKLAMLNSLPKRNFYMDLYIFTRKLNDATWKDLTEKIELRAS